MDRYDLNADIGRSLTLMVSRRETRAPIKEPLARLFPASRIRPAGYREPNGRRAARCLMLCHC